MKPKILHQEAMELSFKAKQSLEENNEGAAFELYKKAADLESQVAEFYFDKPELEPTRSVIIRSAAFLNLKAGHIENAQKFIFFGLVNISDELIREQLNNVLEIVVSLRNMSQEVAYNEFKYINFLRQRSVHYILEPSALTFGHSISLEMIKEFSEGYLKSLKAFAVTKYKQTISMSKDIEDSLRREIEKLINPLITQSSYGSFKFSIANDYLKRPGEEKKLVDFKANVVPRFHHEIFTNPLTDDDIKSIRSKYDDEEINEIFRPLFKLKSNTTPYKIGYFDSENLYKVYLGRIINKQKKQLIAINELNQEDIGELESSIVHTRSTGGKLSKNIIFKEHLKSYSFDYPTNQIIPKSGSPLILNDRILLSVNFNSESGFEFSFDDFHVEYTDTQFARGLSGFYTLFYDKILLLVSIEKKNEQEQKDFDVISKYIGNINSLKK